MSVTKYFILFFVVFLIFAVAVPVVFYLALMLCRSAECLAAPSYLSMLSPLLFAAAVAVLVLIRSRLVGLSKWWAAIVFLMVVSQTGSSGVLGLLPLSVFTLATPLSLLGWLLALLALVFGGLYVPPLPLDRVTRAAHAAALVSIVWLLPFILFNASIALTIRNGVDTAWRAPIFNFLYAGVGVWRLSLVPMAMLIAVFVFLLLRQFMSQAGEARTAS